MNHLDRKRLAERQESLQRQQRDYYRALSHLEEQRAKYGIRVPLDLLNDLDTTRENIERIEAELSQVQAQLERLLAEPEPPEPQAAPAAPPAAPASPEPSPAGVVPTGALAPLVEALHRRSLVPFIGPDLPEALTGLPARADLARDLARRKGLDETLPLAEVAQRASQAGQRWEFTDFLINALDVTGKSPRPFHQAAAALLKTFQLETLITTTYDGLLELACQQAGLAFNRVVRDADVRFANPDRPTLIKLYGDLQQPDTLVVTDKDHTELLRSRDKEEAVDEVKRAFRRNTILFLGYNLADPDFRFLFDQVAESRFARTAYAVWSGLPAADVPMWRDRGIVIMAADPVEVLNELVIRGMGGQHNESS